MPKPLAQLQPVRSGAYGGLNLGMVWGSFAGAIIGAGVSLTIGLIYSSAVLLVATVIAISAILGGLFGHIMASLLADDGSFGARVSGPSGNLAAGGLADYMTLRGDSDGRVIKNQEVMAKIHSMRVGRVDTTAPFSASHAQVLNLVVGGAGARRNAS